MNEKIDQTVVEVTKTPTTAEDVKGITHPREDLKSVTVQSTEVTGVPAVI